MRFQCLYTELVLDYLMHPDAESRLEKLVAHAKPRTEKARIRAMAAEIHAARAAGIPWAEICEALDVRRSTLLAALRGYEPSKTAPVLPAGRKVADEIPAPAPAPDQQTAKPSHVRRWGVKE